MATVISNTVMTPILFKIVFIKSINSDITKCVLDITFNFLMANEAMKIPFTQKD